MTNFDYALQLLGWQGGTIWQVIRELRVKSYTEFNDLAHEHIELLIELNKRDRQ